MIPIRETAAGLSFAVKVHPKARRSAIAGTLGDALKLAVAAPPVEGKANQAVIEFFAALCGVPRSAVAILQGESSRMKTVRISGVEKEALEQALRKALDFPGR